VAREPPKEGGKTYKFAKCNGMRSIDKWRLDGRTCEKGSRRVFFSQLKLAFERRDGGPERGGRGGRRLLLSRLAAIRRRAGREDSLGRARAMKFDAHAQRLAWPGLAWLGLAWPGWPSRRLNCSKVCE